MTTTNHAVPGQFDDFDRARPLASLRPESVLDKLDLGASGLEGAKHAADAGDEAGAFAELLAYYRRKFPLERRSDVASETIDRANKVCDHILQWGPYDEADYGDNIDWDWDPRGDIEWVAAVCRFYWADPLAQAFAQTLDEKYAATFVEMTTDWIHKHPLEDRLRTHSVYTNWKGFVWLDIQTGVRATRICNAFTTLIHGKSFTPAFLQLLLAKLYDHQEKTKWLPMGSVHNKAVFEQRGFINVAYHFSEFAESREWMQIAAYRATESFLLQTTSDGVQREWSFGYHMGVLRDAIEIVDRIKAFGIEPPQTLIDRIRLCYDYLFGIASPDLGAPMFGDAKRPIVDMHTTARSKWQLHGALKQGTVDTGDDKYTARAEGDLSRLPSRASVAWPEAGMYAMRSGWDVDAVHMAIHCSPKAISSHDQPDNGTFELYAFGRWLMPDTGFYTYGHDAEARQWHRRTCVHQTLTLDGCDSAEAGRHRLWQSGETFDALVVENDAYNGLLHRRSIWFVDRRFFVLLDEAIGDVPGELDLHFQFAPGDISLDRETLRAHTQFDDANVLVAACDTRAALHEEDGWFAWDYGLRAPRKAIRFGLADAAPARCVTLVAPYRGTNTPDATACAVDVSVAQERCEIEATCDGATWRVGRDLAAHSAWCDPVQ